MLTILSSENNDIYYKCDCGTRGKCMVKPLGLGTTVVVDLHCASCTSTERVVLVKDKNGDGKTSDSSLCWALVLSNEAVNVKI